MSKRLSILLGSVAALVFILVGAASAQKRFGAFNFTVSPITGSGTSTFSGNILPSTDNTYDLGSLTNRWRTGYFGTSVSSTKFIGASAAGGGTNATPPYTFSGDEDTGFYQNGSNAIGIGLGATAAYSIAADTLRPGTGRNNLADLGTTGVRWRTQYLATSQIFSSGATGIQLYNTADETTNFERGNLTWSGNTFQVGTSVGGSGTTRSLYLRSAGSASARELRIFATADTTAQFDFVTTAAINTPNGVFASIRANTNASAGVYQNLALTPTIAQSGTAGYSALLINPTESSTGSGAKRLISAQVGSQDRFFVDNGGNVFTTSTLNIGNLAASSGAITNGSSLPLYIAFNPTQSQADQGNTAIWVQNASSTIATGLTFTNEDGSSTLFGMNVYGSDTPVRPDFGFSPANMTMVESASGTIMLAGENGLSVFSDGAFRPISGLGFGNSDDIVGAPSTTISNGNMQTVALDFPNSAAAGTQDLTVTVVGASAGDECQLAGADFAASLFSRANESYTCVGTAADTMTVRRTCVAGGGCGDPASVNANVGFFARQ